MTTEVSKSSAAANALAVAQSLKQGLQNVQTHAPSAGGEPILRFDKGSWLYGSDNVEVEAGSKWAINPLSFQHGFNCWKFREQGSKEKAELLGEVLVSAMQVPPLKSSLPDYGPKNDWHELIVFGLRCVSGEDEGEETVYKPTSKGGISATKELLGKIIKQIDDDPAHPVPVIVLESSSYQHDQYGKVFTPVLRIVEWVSMDGIAADIGNTTSEQQTVADSTPAETAPQTRRGRAAPVQQEAANDEDDDETVEQTQPQTQAAPAGGEGVRRRRRAA